MADSISHSLEHCRTGLAVTAQALIRRRVRVVDEDALYRIMVPQPLPLSWGRTVQSYDPSISLFSRVCFSCCSSAHAPHMLTCQFMY